MDCEEVLRNNIFFPETSHQGIVIIDDHVGRCYKGYLYTYPIDALINKCPESTDEYGNTWQESYSGPHFKFNKENGVIDKVYIRECDGGDGGRWSPVDIEDGTLDDTALKSLTCPQDGIWPITPIDAYTIQENSSNIMIRQCNGERGSPKWGDPYTIYTKYCEANDDLPTTKAGTLAKSNDGNTYVYCSKNGWNDSIKIFYKMANYAPSYNHNSIYKDIVEGVVVDSRNRNGISNIVVYRMDDPPKQERTILDSYCPADGEWPAAYGYIVKKCPSGNGVMFRACDYGKWSKVNYIECNVSNVNNIDNVNNEFNVGSVNKMYNVKKCNSEVIDGIVWPETPIKTVTFKNNKLHYCNILQQSIILDPNDLIQNKCPSNVDSIYNIEWPSTYNFEYILKHNNNRYVRFCNDGTWEDEVFDYDSLKPQTGTCPQDGKWPETRHYDYSILEDSSNPSNFLIRFCFPPSEWADPVSFSVSITCPSDGDWSSTEVNKTAELACPTGYTGTQSRFCKTNGTWDTINSSSCQLNNTTHCSVDGDWIKTEVNKTAELACPSGYSGKKTRFCKADGTWDTINSSSCQLNNTTYCSVDGDWIKTEVNKTAELACPTGYTGTQSRFCKADGTWDTINSSSCQLIPTHCSADGDWARTEVNKTAELACSDGYSGKKTRFCKVDGTWDTVNDSCVEESSSWWIWILLIVIVLIFAIVAYFVFVKKDNDGDGNGNVSNNN